MYIYAFIISAIQIFQYNFDIFLMHFGSGLIKSGFYIII